MLLESRFFKSQKNAGYLILVAVVLKIILLFTVISCPSLALADGHEDSGTLEHRVDTEDKTGLNLFIANLYNDYRLLFALVVTATMAVMGIIIGQLTGFLLRLLGLK
jgi:ABC-type phosphate/phosphonate transport system permease subunit